MNEFCESYGQGAKVDKEDTSTAVLTTRNSIAYSKNPLPAGGKFKFRVIDTTTTSKEVNCLCQLRYHYYNILNLIREVMKYIYHNWNAQCNDTLQYLITISSVIRGVMISQVNKN